MAKYGPSSAWLLVRGRDISSETYELTEEGENLTEQTNGIHSTMEQHSNIGLAKYTLEASGGTYDDEVGGIVEALQALGTTMQLVMWAMAGEAVGAAVRMIDGAFVAKWKRIAKRVELVKAHAEYVVSGKLLHGALVSGFTVRAGNGHTQAASLDLFSYPLAVAVGLPSVANPTVFTVAAGHGFVNGDVVLIVGTASTPSTLGFFTVTRISDTQFSIPVNVSASGASPGKAIKSTTGLGNGLTADLHLLSLVLGPATNVIVKMRHSTDNITFADVTSGAFAAKTAIGGERIVATGTINRYVAIQYDGTGAAPTSLTPLVGIAI
jgi:hypothetical protein